MAKAWVTDLWVKDAVVELPDGSSMKVPPSAAQLKAIKTLPEQFRSGRFGRGKRWRVTWEDAMEQKTKARLFATKSEADAYRAELEDDIRMGRYIDPADKERPFSEVAELWYESKRRIKGSTRGRYRRELDNYVIPKVGELPIGAITRVKIDKWVTQLEKGTAPFSFDKNKHIKATIRTPKPASATYIDHIVRATFGSVIRYALKEHWITTNPLANVELPQPEMKPEKLPVLTFAQVEQLARDAYDLRKWPTDAVLVLFLAYTGARISEALALQIHDLEPERLRANIVRTWTEDENDTKVIGSPKGKQARAVPVPDFIMALIGSITAGRDSKDWVFLSKRGVVIDRKRWYFHTWRKLMALREYPEGFRIHDLRHTAASHSIAAGADVKIVQLMLGHKDATETLNIYGHMWPDKLDQVLDLVGRQRAIEVKAPLELTG
ncbi:tyrosine-type recombinase/integrase [Leucobacter sp. 1207-22]|uniref:tyrosine-type recombinase/integrase n=1 Tax=Leucobacter sp. 1207-22 TaxID=2604456 RepID=UPI0040628653